MDRQIQKKGAIFCVKHLKVLIPDLMKLNSYYIQKTIAMATMCNFVSAERGESYIYHHLVNFTNVNLFHRGMS